jgi:hypothetical protein
LPATTTTTTEAPYVPTQTTSTTEPEETITTEPLEEAITTTTEAEKEEETSTTYPDGPFEDIVEPDETTIPETTVPEIFDEPVLDEVEQPQEEEMLLEDTPNTTVLEEEISSFTTIAEFVTDEQVAEVLEEVIEDKPVTNEQIEQILETLSEAEPEQIVEAITQVLAADISSDQATEIASSPEVLAAITETQAEELFEQIVVDELSEEQLGAFTEAIQEAPTEIKQAFEKTIDIFSSKFDEYVPTGSNVPVRTRRTLVVIGSLLTMLPSVHIKTGKS